MNLGQPRGRCLSPIPAHPFHALKHLVSPPNSLGTLLPAPGSQGADGRAGDLCAIWGQNIQTAPLIFHHSICQRCRLRRRIKISARLPSLAAGTSLLPLPRSSRAPRAQGRDSERPRRGGPQAPGLHTPCVQPRYPKLVAASCKSHGKTPGGAAHPRALRPYFLQGRRQSKAFCTGGLWV